MYTAIEFKDATDRELQLAARFANAGDDPKLLTIIERPDLRERDREVLREYLVDTGYKSLLIDIARQNNSVQFSTALPLTHSADVSNRGREFLKALGFFGVSQMLSFGHQALKFTVAHPFESAVEILDSQHGLWDFELAEIVPGIIGRDGRYDDYVYDVKTEQHTIGRLLLRRYAGERANSHIELHPL
jgi:hypothetical protein